jgi:excisionase family DNA binding protein
MNESEIILKIGLMDLTLFAYPYIIIENHRRWIMDRMSVKDAAEKWGISERRIQKLCEEGRIPGVIRFGRSWAILKDAEKPVDGRKRNNKVK